ncbi:hypothetical protein ACVWZZ_005566 [Bradyrhizobium sp. LM6.10]
MPVGTESAHHQGMGATLRVQWLTLRSGRRALRVREVTCDLTFLFGLPQQSRSSHAVLLIQRISSQSSASHAVSNRTNSCIVFCGIVVIGACKADPHVFVTETTRVVLGFLPARKNAGLCRSSPGLKRQSRPISPIAAKSGKGPMRRSRGKRRNSTTVVSMGPSEPALRKRSHLLLGPSDLSASV